MVNLFKVQYCSKQLISILNGDISFNQVLKKNNQFLRNVSLQTDILTYNIHSILYYNNIEIYFS